MPMKRRPKSAGKLVVLENNYLISAEMEQIQSRIRERAYELSQLRRHSGREVDDWLSAESEIISVPPVEMIEKEGAYHVQLVVAGINLEGVNVMATNEQMLIKCEFRHDHAGSGIVHLCDFKSATVFRSVHFPQPIDRGSLKVEFQDGILRITAVKEGAVRAAPERPPAKKAVAKRAGA